MRAHRKAQGQPLEALDAGACVQVVDYSGSISHPVATFEGTYDVNGVLYARVSWREPAGVARAAVEAYRVQRVQR